MAKTATKEKESKSTSTKSNQMFIEKIKLTKENTAIIHYRKSNDNNAQQVMFTGKEEITEEFKKIFQANVEGFIGVLPILAKDQTKITVNAIRFDYGKDDFLKSALYSVKYTFNDANNAVVNISTPLLPIWQESFTESTFCISGKYEDLLHETIKKAKAYINGETRTKQMTLIVDNTQN